MWFNNNTLNYVFNVGLDNIYCVNTFNIIDVHPIIYDPFFNAMKNIANINIYYEYMKKNIFNKKIEITTLC